MDEKQIVDNLRQTIPKQTDPTPPAPPAVVTDEQSSLVPDAINELTLLKIGDELGLIHPTDESTERLKFIYEQLATVAPDTSFEAVQATIRDYLLRLGLTFREDRFMRLYLWLKLNQERVAIDRELAQYGR